MENWRLSDGEQNGISQNIFVAVTLALMAKKNIIIKSDCWDRSIYEIVWILRRIWSIDEFQVIRCNYNMNKDEFNMLFLDHKVNIVIGLDLLNGNCQNLLRDWLRTRQDRVVIGLMGLNKGKYTRILDDDTLLLLLIREFWITQNHEVDDDLKDNSNYGEIRMIEKDNSEILHLLQDKINEITMVPEIHRYIYDIVIHLRNHRCVHRGIATFVIPDLKLLAKSLCVLFNREFVIPTIVKLAVRKLVPIHLVLVPPEQEPTLIYGSDLEFVKELMKRITSEQIVENVLRNVSVPL